MHFVVDTNVPIVANGTASHASAACVLSCITRLRDVISEGHIVLDDSMRILREYMRNLNMSGQPGPGDVFMKWVWQNQADVRHCETVYITPRAGSDTDFDEFPNDPGLAGFHSDDRKFVAAARASHNNPRILIALDSDWWDFRSRLLANGLSLEFICPQEIAELAG